MSKQQAKFFGVIAGGGTPTKGGEGLTQEKAKEMLEGTSYSGLPTKKADRACGPGADFSPQDETLGNWARRHVEQAIRQTAVEAMADVVPQTPAVMTPPVVASKFRDLADRLEGMPELPPELVAALEQADEGLALVLKWLEENGHG